LAAIVLAGLSDHVTISWMRNIKGPAGWEIAPGDDPLFGEYSLKEVYERLEPGVAHTPSVPLLVDLSSKTLLSSSSSQITRFFSRGMNGARPVCRDLSPANLIEQIDAMNEWLHNNVNRAVYEVGFAAEQGDYEKKVEQLFDSLDELERHLAQRQFLFGHELTESDLYLFATLVRFDSVYYPLFKCSYGRIADYPALSCYVEHLRSIDGVTTTYSDALIRQHYFCSVMHVGGEALDLNPSRLIPVGPRISLRASCLAQNELNGQTL
jgi:putative glutathione S-transferase